MLASPTPLHLPDGFLSPWLAGLGWLLAILVVRRAVIVTGDTLATRQVSLMGLLAAVLFAAQAINIPIAFGTSGHLLGGALAAILVGPWAGVIVMTAVVVLQALLFQDGGLLVMGWNVINMGVLTAFSGYLVYQATRRMFPGRPGARWLAGLVGGWISVETGALATAIELALSGTFPLELGIPAMTSVHALIGLGEGLLTAVTLGFLTAVRPGLFELGEGDRRQLRSVGWVAAGVLLILALSLMAPYASELPDGLEWVASLGGFDGLARQPPLQLLPDYTVPILRDARSSTAVAVLLGSLLLLGMGWFGGRATRTAPSS